MPSPEKIAEVKAITERFLAAQSIVLADYTGITVLQMTAFRSLCRAKNVDCRVVKNRLAIIAADNAALSVIKDHLKGPTALVMGMDSQVEAAKLVVEFAKTNPKLKVKGGVVDGGFISADRVVVLSKIPSRDELIARMMGSINSPLTGLACVTNGVAAALTRAVDAVAKQKAAA
jgi:large subunit ribosomal protein L10